METFKFETTVLKDGLIRVPEFEKYEDQHIEILIVYNPVSQKDKPKTSAAEFLKNWTGFAKGEEADDEKYNYLMEKYK